MDKIQRAIEKLNDFNKSRKEYIENRKYDGFEFDDDLFDEFTEYIETAISAMKKRIKEKPKERITGGNILKTIHFICPCCGRELRYVTYLNGKQDHSRGKKVKCCDCGQAVLWEEKENG